MLLILQDRNADILFEKIGEAIGAVIFFILLIMLIVWLVKKVRK